VCYWREHRGPVVARCIAHIEGPKISLAAAKMSRLRYLWVDLGAGLLAPDLLQMK
jgi:hypothetical protein